jgi:hypothetical protein
MFRGTFSGTIRAGTPPKNRNASTCASVHARWSILSTGRTNMRREHDSTITNAHTVTRLPVPGSVHIPNRP